MIVFVDRYSDEYALLKNTLQILETKCDFLTFQDSFWGTETIPVKEYLVRQTETEPYQMKELHNAFLDIPPYWHVMVEGLFGAIYDMDKKKATIYFREPKQKRLVERVEWLAEAGYVCRIDYYNKYGFVACRVIMNAEGKALIKTYYSSKGEEIISHNLIVDSITIFEKGQVKDVFENARSFEKRIYEQFISQDEKIILTSVRQAEIFKECDAESKAKVCVVLNDIEEIKQYQSFGNLSYPLFILSTAKTAGYEVGTAENVFRLCCVGNIGEKKKSRSDALILTMSDRIAGIEKLVEACPELTFHIAANTQVSNKLLELGKKENVRIYPQISGDKLKELLEEAAFYLDINYAGEIHNAIMQASMNRMLILGFEDTLHNKHYVTKQCIFAPNDIEGIIAKLHEVVKDQDAYEKALAEQELPVGKTLELLATRLG